MFGLPADRGAEQFGSPEEVLSDRLIGWCCINRLSSHSSECCVDRLSRHDLPVSHSETSVPIAKRAIKIVRGADQCKVCESLWKIPKCLALRAGLFCKQPEVIGVS